MKTIIKAANTQEGTARMLGLLDALNLGKNNPYYRGDPRYSIYEQAFNEQRERLDIGAHPLES